jgi:hypothetical protein
MAEGCPLIWCPMSRRTSVPATAATASSSGATRHVSHGIEGSKLGDTARGSGGGGAGVGGLGSGGGLGGFEADMDWLVRDSELGPGTDSRTATKQLSSIRFSSSAPLRRVFAYSTSVICSKLRRPIQIWRFARSISVRIRVVPARPGRWLWLCRAFRAKSPGRRDRNGCGPRWPYRNRLQDLFRLEDLGRLPPSRSSGGS